MPCPQGLRVCHTDSLEECSASGHALALCFFPSPGPWPLSPVLWYKRYWCKPSHQKRQQCPAAVAIVTLSWCLMHNGTGIRPLKSPVSHKSLSPDWSFSRTSFSNSRKANGVLIGLLSYCSDPVIADYFLLDCFRSCLHTGQKMIPFPDVLRVIIIPIRIWGGDHRFPYWVFIIWHVKPCSIPPGFL